MYDFILNDDCNDYYQADSAALPHITITMPSGPTTSDMHKYSPSTS
jgi:hypothetical protein